MWWYSSVVHVMLQTLFLQSRRIVVRTPNGILREANWKERDRMCQVETVSVPYTQSGTETTQWGMNLTLSLVPGLHNGV